MCVYCVCKIQLSVIYTYIQYVLRTTYFDVVVTLDDQRVSLTQIIFHILRIFFTSLVVICATRVPLSVSYEHVRQHDVSGSWFSPYLVISCPWFPF